MTEPPPENGRFYRIEVARPARRLRCFSAETKAALVAEASEPGAVVTAIARREGLDPGQLFRWRAEARRRAVSLQDKLPEHRPREATCGAIEIEVDGVTLRIPAGTSRETIWAAVEAVIDVARRPR
jgi:transposase